MKSNHCTTQVYKNKADSKISNSKNYNTELKIEIIKKTFMRNESKMF